MITIGQLATYVGVTTKTIRVYHAKGLLPEPARDRSGYRRYTAHHAAELIKIRTMAEAGVSLAVIRELSAADAADVDEALCRADQDLTLRIQHLKKTQRRLRQLAVGHLHILPPDVTDHLQQLPTFGFSQRWVDLEADLWLLVFAAHPDNAAKLFSDQAEALTDPRLRQIYLDYDQAHDLDPADPRVDNLANRIVEASAARYQAEGPPSQNINGGIPSLIQSTVNSSSPAWERLDHLIRQRLHMP